MVPGSLGDLGYLDSAATGIKQAKSTLHAQTRVVEAGGDTSAWKQALQTLSGRGYNVIVTADSGNNTQNVAQVAKQNPKQKYLIFGSEVAGKNIASATYLSHDGAFLAGVLAALATADKASFPLVSGRKTVGFIGGMNVPVIQDFLVGFKQGVRVVDPSVKVLTSFVGAFDDPQTGYNQAVTMLNRGADVLFAAAGGSGLGALKAASAKKRYAIGVDSDQNGTYPGHVLASDLKNVGATVESMLAKAKASDLTFGKTYVFGLANNGVSLLLDNKIVPAVVAAKLKTYTEQVKSGKVKVPCVKPFCQTATK